MDCPCGTAFRLHLHHQRHRSPQVDFSCRRPCISKLAHRCRWRDRVDGNYLTQCVCNSSNCLIAFYRDPITFHVVPPRPLCMLPSSKQERQGHVSSQPVPSICLHKMSDSFNGCNHIKRWSRMKNHENHAQFIRPPPLNDIVGEFKKWGKILPKQAIFPSRWGMSTNFCA